MEVLLVTQLEALFFNLSFDFFTVVGSLWTWVAVFSAALLSFSWQVRIRITTVSSPTPSPTKLDSSSTLTATKSDPSPPPHHLTQQHQLEEQSSPELLYTPYCPEDYNVELYGGMRKGKFTVYLQEEELVMDSVKNEDDGEINFDDEICDIKKGSRCESWDYMIVRRCGDLEWHRCLDFNSLNGNVVKLWEDERRACSQFRMSR